MLQWHDCVMEKPFVLVRLKGHKILEACHFIWLCYRKTVSVSNGDVQEVYCVKLFLNFVILLLLCHR